METKLLFIERALPLILKAFGYSIDKDGFIEADGQRIEAKRILGFYQGYIITGK